MKQCQFCGYEGKEVVYFEQAEGDYCQSCFDRLMEDKQND